MKIAILGYAREGKSVLGFLKRSPRYKNAEVWILDKNRKLKIPSNGKSRLGKTYLKNLPCFDVIFRSPGTPWNLPELEKARRAGVAFSSATKLFFESASRRTRNIIGITGTKGKGTTSTLLYAILRDAHKPVFLAGNIGMPALDLIPKLKKNSTVILELSSFQLQDLEMSPHVAAVLDVFPDHQDAHASLREYYGAKTSIARYQKKSDVVFFLKNNPVSARIARSGAGKKIAVDPIKNNGLLRGVILKIPGNHNFKNAVMAATVAKYLGIPISTILRTVKNYRGMEHRLEFVRHIKSVSFWNDSASTNPQTAAAAIHAFPNAPKILIAGGQDKGLDYAPLARALKNSDTKLAVLFGENKKKIAKAIRRNGQQETRIMMVNNLPQAVKGAYRFAKKLTAHYPPLPIAVLFSPGAASFDQFRDYADRGRAFKDLTKKLK
jgi:UDP-N-acetylmuramoylalanine--D-glutamate ligase